MATNPLKATPATPGLILKRWLQARKVPHDRAARQAGIAPKTLWRIFTGELFLDGGRARKIIAGCRLDAATAEELLAALDKQRAAGRESSRKSMAALHFGRFLADLRKKTGTSGARLAEACKFKQPNVAAFETGRSVPSPLVAGRIATILKLSPGDAADFFRLLGAALAEHSAVSKDTTIPALCSLAEWTLFSQAGIPRKAASVGVPVSSISNAEKAIPLVQAALAEAGKQFAAQARQLSPAPNEPLINACIKHDDGKVTFILPVSVTI